MNTITTHLEQRFATEADDHLERLKRLGEVIPTDLAAPFVEFVDRLFAIAEAVDGITEFHLEARPELRAIVVEVDQAVRQAAAICSRKVRWCLAANERHLATGVEPMVLGLGGTVSVIDDMLEGR
jgi:hypothetical protein